MGIWGTDPNINESRSDEMNLVLGAYRSLRSPIAYGSMPITSGELFYEVLEKKGCKNLEELAQKDKDSLYLDIIVPNIKAGIEFADTLPTLSSLTPVAPSVFEAKKQRWSQQEYMFLWYRVIEERAQKMYMMKGWNFSNGGVQEFVRAMEMQFGFVAPHNGMDYVPKTVDKEKLYEAIKKIRVYDHNGTHIGIDKGSLMISNAILNLKKRGFEADSLSTSLRKLRSIAEAVQGYGSSRHDEVKPYLWQYMDVHRAYEAVDKAA